MTEQEIIELLTESGALLDGHFRLSSGLHSGRYLQCAVALQHPSLAEKLGRALAARWRETVAKQICTVVSPALGGVIIGHEVGRALGTRACFTERVGGEMALRRGFELGPGLSVLVVEDVVTTGRSTNEAIAVADAAGAEVVAVGAIVDRTGGRSPFAVSFVALTAVELPVWERRECPLCEEGSRALKPGSRP